MNDTNTQQSIVIKDEAAYDEMHLRWKNVSDELDLQKQKEYFIQVGTYESFIQQLHKENQVLRSALVKVKGSSIFDVCNIVDKALAALDTVSVKEKYE